MGDAGKYYRDMGQSVVNDLNNKPQNDDAYAKALQAATDATNQALDSGEIDGSDGSIGDYMSQQMIDQFNQGNLGDMSREDFISRMENEDMGYASPMTDVENQTDAMNETDQDPAAQQQQVQQLQYRTMNDNAAVDPRNAKSKLIAAMRGTRPLK